MIPTSTLAFASALLPSQIAPVILMRGAVRPATSHKIGIANNAATTENLNVLVPISPTVSGCTAFRNITRGQGHSQYTSQRTNY
ncbi:hypothetical protein F5141DRAFT_1156091 [Pisolithus sp. B1]|nr:hypothetical protein F5141DRAFT_1156091 [Pisolithus sp. B1]